VKGFAVAVVAAAVVAAAVVAVAVVSAAAVSDDVVVLQPANEKLATIDMLNNKIVINNKDLFTLKSFLFKTLNYKK
jgi:archaellum component FlaF (FlaF/FlaG flagellin family)